jgi:hypothetical protein
MQITELTGFYIEAVGIDGQTVGKAFQEQGKLSGKWLTIFSHHLQSHGAVFDTPLEGPLAHIRIQFTAANSSALATLSVHEVPAASLLLLGGKSPETEKALGEMFIQSMRRSFPAQATGAGANAFQQILSSTERPMIVVVPLPNEGVEIGDRELVKEITQHLAGAFFAGQAATN